MHKFEKESNGHQLSIIINEEELQKTIDKELQKAQETFRESEDIEKDGDEDAWHDNMYGYNSVYGDEDEYCTFEEVKDSLEKAQSTLADIIANPNLLWDKVQTKKNGTFKLNSKPQLWMSCYGPYWEDSYGWRVLVLRIVPHGDTTAYVEFDNITEHY